MTVNCPYQGNRHTLHSTIWNSETIVVISRERTKRRDWGCRTTSDELTMARPKLTLYLDIVSPFAYMAFYITKVRQPLSATL